MTDNSRIDEAVTREKEIEAVAAQMNESTGLTWLWAFLFGPIYFWVHGFVGAGFLAILTQILIIVNPIMAYALWRKRARQKAELHLMMAKR